MSAHGLDLDRDMRKLMLARLEEDLLTWTGRNDVTLSGDPGRAREIRMKSRGRDIVEANNYHLYYRGAKNV